jgi:polysaccharide pyruvyl transferase WcaK-like protein
MIRADLISHGRKGQHTHSADEAAVSTGEFSSLGRKISRGGSPSSSPRIALLDSYLGNNLGDASIQDAMVANIGVRLPKAQFYGITLNSQNFVDQHGVGAFPLVARYLPSYGMSSNRYAENATEAESSTKTVCGRAIKSALKKVPILHQCLPTLATIPREIIHIIGGYYFLRGKDLLVVSGGGQLSEEWGGAWGHPFALFKWAVLARIARVPYAVVSVGAGTVRSQAGRLFVSTALRMASYRSYRDKNTREIVTALLGQVTADPVVPDLAFSLPSSQIPRPIGIRDSARGKIIAISPISYAKPGYWSFEDGPLYDRYVDEMARVISRLLERGCFLILVCSSLGHDETVIPDLLSHLDDEAKRRIDRQVSIPKIGIWKNLVAILRDVDLLIASRLHSTILGFMSETPTLAISFDPKVNWVMEDLGQTDYLLQIDNFTCSDVIEALDRLQLRKDVVLQQIASYRDRVASLFAGQYDALADLAVRRIAGTVRSS